MELEIIFGELLKKLRHDKGLSQDKLAEKCGLHVNYISFLERGINQPSLKTLFLIAEALEMKPEELVKMISKEFNRK